MKEKVISILNSIRPMLQRDGGDVKFLDMDDNYVVKVQLQGACAGCPGATMTLKNVIEQELKNKVSQKIAVINV